MIRFKKIKITSDDKIHFEYEKMNKNGDWDTHTMTSSQLARPELYHALDNLIPHIVVICELPVEDHLQHAYTMKGVSFSYGGDEDVMGVTMTATRSLDESNAPLVLNTPHKPADSYSPGADETNLLPYECVKDLRLLCERAEDYLAGKRAQADLFDEPEGIPMSLEEIPEVV